MVRRNGGSFCYFFSKILGKCSGGSRISLRWRRQPSGWQGGGEPTHDFAKFSQKLHGIERNWTPIDPPLRSQGPINGIISVCECSLVVSTLIGGGDTRTLIGCNKIFVHTGGWDDHHACSRPNKPRGETFTT